MALNCVDEVLRVIGGAFEEALKDPAIGPRLAASRLLVRLGLVDPDCVLVIDAEHGQVRLAGVAEPGACALLAMNAATANECCQGRVDLEQAAARGDVAMVGDLGSLLEIVRDQEGLPRLYAQVLRREGREDLLVA